jgi:hypothetical protein
MTTHTWKVGDIAWKRDFRGIPREVQIMSQGHFFTTVSPLEPSPWWFADESAVGSIRADPPAIIRCDHHELAPRPHALMRRPHEGGIGLAVALAAAAKIASLPLNYAGDELSSPLSQKEAIAVGKTYVKKHFGYNQSGCCYDHEKLENLPPEPTMVQEAACWYVLFDEYRGPVSKPHNYTGRHLKVWGDGHWEFVRDRCY